MVFAGTSPGVTLLLLLALPCLLAAQQTLAFPGQVSVAALCSSQSIALGPYGVAGQGEEMMVLITGSTFYRVRKTGQTCDDLEIADQRTTLELSDPVRGNVTIAISDVVYATCQLTSVFGTNYTQLTVVLVTRQNQLVEFISSYPFWYFTSTDVEPLPAGLEATDVRFLTTLASPSSTCAELFATSDGVYVTGATSLRIALPPALGKTVESVVLQITGAQQVPETACPNFEMLYVRSISGGEEESFYIQVNCSDLPTIASTPAYFLARPHAVFVTPDCKTVWAQATAGGSAWALEQDAASQSVRQFRDFDSSDEWLEQREPTNFNLLDDRPIAVSERAFGSYSTLLQRSQLYTRFRSDPLGSVAVKTQPLASSSLYYLVAEQLAIHMVITRNPSGLLLQCSVFDASFSAALNAKNDEGNCVLTGCGAFECCVQQPDTYLNRCSSSCLSGFTCLKNHTCV
jgi:hypothetical protein